MSNIVTTALYVGFAFFGGFIVGLGLELVLNLIFWFCVGYLAMMALDAAMGLAQPVCDAREWVRGIWNSIFDPGDDFVVVERPIRVNI